jgi:lysophospholipase L1-like esterase
VATEGSNVGRALLLGTGFLFLVAALLYDPRLFAPLAPEGFAPLTLEKLRGVRVGFVVAGGVLLALAELARRTPALGSALSRRGVASALLALCGLGVPLALLDFGLRPFVEPKTTIYTRDRELGWRLAPGAEDEYGGARVRINARGLRGPELEPAKPPGSLRMLWLGDSVTFGYGVEPVEATFPYRVAAQLAPRLRRPLETLAAGVGGYAPWQERIWLEREGWHYAPDLVVVGFVLNDLTEPLSLVRYGGQGEGWQLARSARGALDRWLSASALVTFLREGIARVRFGRDVRLGAEALEAFDVRRLVADPGAALWERSWRITESSLAGIFASARQRGVPAVLVIFPYAFQLEAPEQMAAVQRRVAAIAQAAGVPVLDLLPALAARKQTALFLDASHISPAGHAAVAEEISEFLEQQALLPPAPAAQAG